MKLLIMKVLTLTDSLFGSACHDLAAIIMPKFTPDVVFGVRTGGKLVADIVVEDFKKVNPKLLYFDIETHRNGHKVKENGFISSMLAALPRFMTDKLRIAEAFLFNVLPRSQRREVIINTDIVTPKNNCKILILDDAIDSGITMKSIIEKIRTLFPDSEIKTAAITVTTSLPAVDADFCLYRKTLIRFPWSKDMKK